MRRRQNRATSERHISPGQTDSGGRENAERARKSRRSAKVTGGTDRETGREEGAIECFLRKMARVSFSLVEMPKRDATHGEYIK